MLCCLSSKVTTAVTSANFSGIFESWPSESFFAPIVTQGPAMDKNATNPQGAVLVAVQHVLMVLRP